jgi:hypothetical protein
MIWGVALGFALWGDLPDAWILTGSAIVVASGLTILRREMRREAGREAAAGVPPVAAAPAPAARRG